MTKFRSLDSKSALALLVCSVSRPRGLTVCVNTHKTTRSTEIVPFTTNGPKVMEDATAMTQLPWDTIFLGRWTAPVQEQVAAPARKSRQERTLDCCCVLSGYCVGAIVRNGVGARVFFASHCNWCKPPDPRGFEQRHTNVSHAQPTKLHEKSPAQFDEAVAEVTCLRAVSTVGMKSYQSCQTHVKYLAQQFRAIPPLNTDLPSTVLERGGFP